MDEKSFLKYYATQLQNKTEEPLPHVLKSQEYFRIKPSEIGYKTLDKVSFVNHNLDIITNPSDSYLYLTVGVKTKVSTGSVDINLDADPNMVKPGGYEKTDVDPADLEIDVIPERYWKTMSIPASAGFIFGYCYKINDTVIDVCNNDCSKGLCAVNSGVFAPQHKSEQHTGLSEPEKFLMYQSHKKAGFMEFLVPLKYVIPFMEANQTLWGVKQSLDITKASVLDMFAYHNPSYATMTGSVTEFNISSMEWLLPYVKVENVTQSEIFDSMYNNVIKRYWLGRETFVSSQFKNTQPNTNEIYRIASKGLNNQPRWLLINAVEGAPSDALNNTSEPLGFVDAGNDSGDMNNFCLTKLRIKCNGIYIDAGVPMEMSSISVSLDTDEPYKSHKGYWEPYHKYCKYHGQLHNSEVLSPLSFNDWVKSQVYIIDLMNTVDTEQIFKNANNTIVIEIEFSTNTGSVTADTSFRMVATLLHDREVEISHSNNTARIISN
jgi:hypothetical protein